MTMTPNDARARVAQLWPQFRKERERLDMIDRWWRWSHDKPHQPRQATREYRELVARAQTPWLGLVVAAVVQGLYVDGYLSSADEENPESDPDESPAWSWWQRNRQDAQQSSLHEAAVAYGLAYSTVLPGVDPLTGDSMPVMRNLSPRNMMAFYTDPANDEWPTLAFEAQPARINGAPGFNVRLYDDESRYILTADGAGGSFSWVATETHDVGVCPVVRYVNRLDLEGRAVGEVEPYIAVAGRIDQTTFDRLVVQRFASWIVRTISGMSQSETTKPGETPEQAKLRLKVEDFLVAEDPDTKFGSLPASPLGGFNESKQEDVRDLAAVSQTAPHHLLGQMVNLSAEALAAAEAAANRKKVRTAQSLGEGHEQRFRLASHVMGDTAGARDTSAQVRWRDTDSRSLAQAADAWGKLVTMLGYPAELAWEKIPGVTQDDIERAKKIVDANGGIDVLLASIAANAAPSGPQPVAA